ncbi:LCP family protein [Waterburya agarophytonicola K14]|uniref:LCP family protein n=1 Tax=Waterburya agarophytonicola KI4 TaxID=2874699 RepID=A0A964BNL7_9CYAN|nr:LCP family protein [Waterburya agarophytonicola]MCC0175941.1 LCP family protein [Waterburya agarophytonicola KI4]
MNKRRAILVGLGLAGVSLVSAGVGAFLAVALSTASPLQKVELSPEEQKVFSQEKTVSVKNLTLPELDRPVNVLVLGIKVITSDLDKKGIDYEKQDVGYLHLVNSFDGLSDSMLLLRFDPKKEKVSVLSIPRDTRIYIDGHGVRKINHANEYGGPALAASTASELLGGINIDRYVRVNVQGVEKLIDALGGVTVNVPKDMKYTDFSQHLYIDLKKGIQHLDGDKAMQFLRYRYDEYGDISRVQRQQMLMRSTVEQTLKPATVVKIPKILSVIQSHLDTNLTVRELMALANFASQRDRSHINMMMLPGDFNSGDEPVSYWLPNYEGINKLMVSHFNLPSYEKEYNNNVRNTYASLDNRFNVTNPRIRIAVQDSTKDQQVLQSALDALRGAGYRRVFATKNWQNPLPKTRVIAQSGDDKAAEEVKSVLGVGEVVVESTGYLQSDITVQIGRDWEKQIKPLIESDLEIDEQFERRSQFETTVDRF